ncbi:hypothetical protein [Pseudemcibacter aquimaris]|uniref:hypothetical protein n=1 Tax=Pseudemcibacter aquimaris TaxID=2857064 RepID=UPI0020111146|nr:hypothetical protein [Pseudemcibacter aquimaris]MCC3860155.1 hypothetical protein [Pseudemcibacter aquimaris]WDU57482.1 hypothetical protein KW060_09765 [Pseudemcibacter aquimaris]
MLNFNEPIMMLMVLPAAITVIGHALFRFFAGEGIGHTLANSSLIIAFMITMLIYYGVPTLPIRVNTDQLFFICLISLCFGMLQDRYPKMNLLSPQVHIALMILVVFWIYANNANFPVARVNIYALAFITIISIILFLKLEDIQYNALQAPVSLFWAAVGLFVVAKGANIPLSENLMMILIASFGAYLVLNFPKPKFPFGASALYPGFLIILSVAMQMHGTDPSLGFSLVILTMIFYSEDILGLVHDEYATPLIRLIMPAFPIFFAWIFS